MAYRIMIHVPLRSRVELRGLLNEEMNGKVGCVDGFDEKSGRVVVVVEGSAAGGKKVKPQNVVSAWREGPFMPGDHARFAFRLSDDRLVCREHACEACGRCCTDFGLPNKLRKKEIDGFDDTRAKVVAREYFARPVQ
eukprot:3935615-Rhodomonas_salina.1